MLQVSRSTGDAGSGGVDDTLSGSDELPLGHALVRRNPADSSAVHNGLAFDLQSSVLRLLTVARANSPGRALPTPNLINHPETLP